MQLKHSSGSAVLTVLFHQSHFKSQGNQLIPDGPEEQALMYQRMFEGLTFYEKLGKASRFYFLSPVHVGRNHGCNLEVWFPEF